MKLAVLADLHGNWEALSAVRADLEARGADQIVCLGDTIGYNANPAECVQWLMDQGIPTIRGNHERLLLGEADQPTRPETMAAIEHARRTLSEDQVDWIRALPDDLVYQSEYLLVHGSPRHPDEYLNATPKIKAALKKMKSTYGGIDLCFFGHTHLALIANKRGISILGPDSKSVPLKRMEICLINPGSVGQPRDGCPRASYLLYDDEEHALDFRRVDYDITAAQEQIRAVGLDERLADRLQVGR